MAAKSQASVRASGPAAPGQAAEARSVLAFARHQVAQRIAKLGRELDRARSDRGGDAVHDLRVAARRLVSTIDCFRSVHWGAGTRALRKRAKAVLRSGREVRDLDIAMGLAADAGVDRRSALVLALGHERDRAETELEALVRRKRFRKFAQKWPAKLGEAGPGADSHAQRDGAAEHLKRPAWEAVDSCTANASRVLPRMASAFFAEGRPVCAGTPSPGDLHRLRLAGKRLRYTLELFRDCYRSDLLGRLRSLRRIQRLLGAVSDCDATGTLLQAHGLARGPDAAILVASLSGRSSADSDAFLEYWTSRFDAPGQERDWVEFLQGGLR